MAFRLCAVGQAWLERHTMRSRPAYALGSGARCAVVESLPDGVLVLDAAERILDANSAAGRLLDVAPDRLSGRSLDDALGHHPDLVRTYRSLPDTPVEVRLELRDAVRYVDLTVSSFARRSRREAGRVVVLHDVTEQRLAHVEERAQQRFLTLLNDLARAAIETADFREMLQKLADRLGQLLAADGCYITLYDEAAGRTLPGAAFGELRDTYATLLPEPGELTLTESVLAAGRVLAIEDVFDTPYLSPRVVAQSRARSALGLPLTLGRQKLGAVLIVYNEARSFSAAEMARAQQAAGHLALAVAKGQMIEAIADGHRRLLALINASRDGMVLVSPEGSVLVVNTPFLRLLRLPERPDDWTNRALDALAVPGQDESTRIVASLQEELAQAHRGDDGPHEGQYILNQRIVQWVSLPVATQGAVLGRLFVLSDTTEEYLVRQMRDSLTHMMVHDLRNPLTTISVALDMLRYQMDESLSANERDTLAIASTSTERMLKLVRSILDVSRLEIGQMPVNREPISVAELVADAVYLQSPQLQAANLTVRNRVPAGLPPAWADRDLVARVLQNLLSNAVKFSARGGIIEIDAGYAGSGSHHLAVSISDHGPGIPPEIESRLFEKFVTGQKSQEETGSGLGLAFCKLAVEAQGGTIGVKSEPQQGTTITFSLPLARLPELS